VYAKPGLTSLTVGDPPAPTSDKSATVPGSRHRIPVSPNRGDVVVTAAQDAQNQRRQEDIEGLEARAFVV
jgi:hypothetical protein